MNPVFQSWMQVLAIAVVLVGALMYQAHYIDKRLESFEKGVNQRFDDLKLWIESRLQRLEDRVGRLEHPVFRP